MTAGAREFQVMAKLIGAFCNLDCRYCYYSGPRSSSPMIAFFEPCTASGAASSAMCVAISHARHELACGQRFRYESPLIRLLSAHAEMAALDHHAHHDAERHLEREACGLDAID